LILQWQSGGFVIWPAIFVRHHRARPRIIAPAHAITAPSPRHHRAITAPAHAITAPSPRPITVIFTRSVEIQGFSVKKLDPRSSSEDDGRWAARG